MTCFFFHDFILIILSYTKPIRDNDPSGQFGAAFELHTLTGHSDLSILHELSWRWYSHEIIRCRNMVGYLGPLCTGCVGF